MHAKGKFRDFSGSEEIAFLVLWVLFCFSSLKKKDILGDRPYVFHIVSATFRFISNSTWCTSI